MCKEACLAAQSVYAPEVVMFYLARWCQKKAKRNVPDLDALGGDALRDAAKRIVRNLDRDGARVERLIAGDGEEWSELERLLIASARRRAGEAAREHAEGACQKIAIVLLTGTPPSRAAERLRHELEGPSNEYVFYAPFSFWARRVVINLVIDEHRRRARQRKRRVVRGPKPPPRLDPARLREAYGALPALLDAVPGLPDKQRSAMVLSMARSDVDELARERLQELAPDLFCDTGAAVFASDEEIAEHLDTTARRVAANRSAARRKLAKCDPRWELLLDFLLPHASTRPIAAAKEPLAASAPMAKEGSDG